MQHAVRVSATFRPAGTSEAAATAEVAILAFIALIKYSFRRPARPIKNGVIALESIPHEETRVVHHMARIYGTVDIYTDNVCARTAALAAHKAVRELFDRTITLRDSLNDESGDALQFAICRHKTHITPLTTCLRKQAEPNFRS